MPDSIGRRRFIAGAVCPRCGQMDKIVVDAGTDRRECVACGFSDSRPGGDDKVAVEGEVATRVNRASARLPDTQAEVVKLIDPDA